VKTLEIIYCSKKGQLEKELDFKHLFQKRIGFVHRFFTKPVEKVKNLVDIHNPQKAMEGKGDEREERLTF